MNFPTAAGEVETHKFQLSIVYHLLLFSVGVRRLPRSRFLASAMLSKDNTRTELGKRPIPTRRVGHNLNTITYRRSLLSRQPNSYHLRNRKDKREDNLVSHSLLLFGYSGNNQVTSSPGWDRHRTTRPGPRCVPPFFLFHYPLPWHTLSIYPSIQVECTALSPVCANQCRFLYKRGYSWKAVRGSARHMLHQSTLGYHAESELSAWFESRFLCISHAFVPVSSKCDPRCQTMQTFRNWTEFGGFETRFLSISHAFVPVSSKCDPRLPNHANFPKRWWTRVDSAD